MQASAVANAAAHAAARHILVVFMLASPRRHHGSTLFRTKPWQLSASFVPFLRRRRKFVASAPD
jgi:hypothetical protein